MEKTPPVLYERMSAQIAQHIPSDNKKGKWKTAEIPLGYSGKGGVALDSEAEGHWFESSSARHSTPSEEGSLSAAISGARPAFSPADSNRVANGAARRSVEWPRACSQARSVVERQQGSMKTNERALTRREPKQQRSRQTVEAVLEAVQRVLKRHGAEAITTNRIAEAAGVSIGSLYQYFPDKQAIFTALYDRHVDEVRHLIERTMTDYVRSPG